MCYYLNSISRAKGLNRGICPSKLNIRNYVILDYISGSMYVCEFSVRVAKGRGKNVFQEQSCILKYLTLIVFYKVYTPASCVGCCA